MPSNSHSLFYFKQKHKRGLGLKENHTDDVEVLKTNVSNVIRVFLRPCVTGLRNDKQLIGNIFAVYIYVTWLIKNW